MIQGVHRQVIFAVMGFNTSVHTPFYPLALLLPRDQVHIIQVGRTIRMCKIQLLERWPWRAPLPHPCTLVLCCNLPFSPHLEVSHHALLFPFSVVLLTWYTRWATYYYIYCLLSPSPSWNVCTVRAGFFALFTEVFPAPRVVFDL